MAYPISAYFGRDTYALLGKCNLCGKPYAENGGFTTLHGNGIDGADVWVLFCDECIARVKEGGDD